MPPPPPPPPPKAEAPLAIKDAPKAPAPQSSGVGGGSDNEGGCHSGDAPPPAPLQPPSSPLLTFKSLGASFENAYGNGDDDAAAEAEDGEEEASEETHPVPQEM